MFQHVADNMIKSMLIFLRGTLLSLCVVHAIPNYKNLSRFNFLVCNLFSLVNFLSYKQCECVYVFYNAGTNKGMHNLYQLRSVKRADKGLGFRIIHQFFIQIKQRTDNIVVKTALFSSTFKIF